MENAVSSADGAQRGVIFLSMRKDERLTALASLGTPYFTAYLCCYSAS
jgi:hypothetical protein